MAEGNAVNVTSMKAISAQLQSDSAGPRRRVEEYGSPQAEQSHLSKLLYKRHGLRENPFGVTPNPDYFYESKGHTDARASLIVGIESGVGFQALIAPPGMGKSTILFSILERLNKIARTAFLFQLHGDSCDFLRHLISELGGEAHDSDQVRMQDTINRILISERQVGRQTIIVVDEAQSLQTSVLETVRLLSNFQTSTEKSLQIILAGQPQLAQRLACPDLLQLSQRISIMTTLIPFGLEDTTRYIEHRLKIAGYQGQPLFTSEALTLIWKHSRGTPREINKLCFNAMLLGSTQGEKRIDSEVVREVVSDFSIARTSCKIGAFSTEIRDTQKGARTNHALRPETTNPRLASSCKDDFCEPANDQGHDEIVVCNVDQEASIGKRPTTSVHPSSHDRHVGGADSHANVAETASAKTINAETIVKVGDVQQLTGQIARVKLKTDAGKDLNMDAAGALSLDAAPEKQPQRRVDPIRDLATASMNSERKVKVCSSESSSTAQLTIFPSDILFGEPVDSGSLPAQAHQDRMNTEWQTHKARVYLGTAVLILLLVVGWPGRPAGIQASAFLEVLGLTDSPPKTVRNFSFKKTHVWIDNHTGLYYCPAEELYGRTQGGTFATEEDAQYRQFRHLNHKSCE